MFDVLHVLPSIDPRHGGPSRTVPALAAAQRGLGAAVGLVTVGHAPEGFSANHPGVAVHAFPARPGPLGSVFACASGLEEFLDRHPARVIHAHGLWQRPLRYAARAAHRHQAPLMLAPRGMLEPWALGHHTWKKRLAARFIHPRALHTLAGWHATSAQEAGHLPAPPRWVGAPENIPVCVAPNGVVAPPPESAAPARDAWMTTYPKLSDTRVALFYGRLHRKKRVAELIELWRSRPRPGWTLLVAGIPGDYTIVDLESLAGDDPGSSIVVADGTPLPQPYALADLFLLPSHSENFGQAVAEALAAGVPALVTDTLPWRELDQAGAGRCVSWAEYPAALDALLSAPESELRSRGSDARAWVLREFGWERGARILLDFYQNLAAVG